jgi:hypothetical protein
MAAAAKALPTLMDVQGERLRRAAARARDSLLDFVVLTTPGFKPGWFHRVLCERLEAFAEAVSRGESPRLIVAAPPRHGKSTIVSQRFPAWVLGRYPGNEFIVASYAQDLADSHSRAAREIARSDVALRVFPDLRPRRRAIADGGAWNRNDIDKVRDWMTGGPLDALGNEVRGRYKSTGVGGALTGHGCTFLIIDDPIKDAAEASSAQRRELIDEWYGSTAYTRVAPGGGVLLMATRWHKDDLTGRRLADMAAGKGDRWEVLDFAAIAEADEPHRAKGEPLHAERFPLAALEAIKATLSAYFWSALYQQRPSQYGGSVVKSDWLNRARYGTPPAAFDRIVQSWDTAGSQAAGAAFSACVTVGEVGQDVYVLAVERERLLYPDLRRRAKGLAARWRPNVVLVEDKHSGQQLLADLRVDPEFEPVPVAMDPVGHGDKWTRYNVESPAIEAGRFHLPDAPEPWAVEYESELTAYPVHPSADQVDATSQLLRYLRENPCSGGFAEQMAQW